MGNNGFISILKGAKSEVEQVLKEMQELEDYKKNGHLDPVYVQREIDPKLFNLRMRLTNIKDLTRVQVRKFAEEKKESIRKKNEIHGGELTDDAKLFTCGVKLTSREVEDILDRNCTNPTMVQLALRYAQENGIKVMRAYNDHTDEIRACKNYQDAAEIYISHWIDKDAKSEVLASMFGDEGDSQP